MGDDQHDTVGLSSDVEGAGGCEERRGIDQHEVEQVADGAYRVAHVHRAVDIRRVLGVGSVRGDRQDRATVRGHEPAEVRLDAGTLAELHERLVAALRRRALRCAHAFGEVLRARVSVDQQDPPVLLGGGAGDLQYG